MYELRVAAFGYDVNGEHCDQPDRNKCNCSHIGFNYPSTPAASSKAEAVEGSTLLSFRHFRIIRFAVLCRYSVFNVPCGATNSTEPLLLSSLDSLISAQSRKQGKQWGYVDNAIAPSACVIVAAYGKTRCHQPARVLAPPHDY